MKFKIGMRLKVIVLNFLSLFNRKKRTTAVLAETPVVNPIQPQVEVQRESHTPAVGRLRDITMMLDEESCSNFEKRERFVK